MTQPNDAMPTLGPHPPGLALAPPDLLLAGSGGTIVLAWWPTQVLRRLAALLLAALALILGGCAAPPDRPATVVGGPLSTAGPASPPPRLVAVILPANGRYAEAGAALRQALRTAQTADGGQGAELRYFDSHEPAAVPGLLRQAAASGASLAIGPLEKEAVDALAQQTSLPLPTLALNQATTEARPPLLYQFALDPEEEGTAAAHQAWRQGYHSAILLYPSNPWGERLADGIRREWLGRGGYFAATHAYEAEVPTLPSELLSAAFAGSIQTAPADCVFMVATTSQAMGLWPQIQALAPPQTPTFATSHVYENGLSIAQLQALTGLLFVDMPWMIDNNGTDPLSRTRLTTTLGLDPRYARLYAMGLDAYHLMAHLDRLIAHPGAYLEGRTGRLSIDSQGRVHRELVLARIDARGPQRLTGGTMSSGPERGALAVVSLIANPLADTRDRHHGPH